MPFDYNAPAELFLAKRTKSNRENSVETLRIPKALGASLQVGDERFNSTEIQRLYEADDYPLRRP
jgi:hypothetical protein